MVRRQVLAKKVITLTNGYSFSVIYSNHWLFYAIKLIVNLSAPLFFRDLGIHVYSVNIPSPVIVFYSGC